MSGADSIRAETGRPSRARTVISAIVGLVIVVAVVAVVVPNAGSYEQAFQDFQGIPPVWIGALVVAGVANILVYPFTVLVAVPNLGYGPGFVERQSGFLVSNTIPGGGAIAVGTQYSILDHYRVPASLAAAAVSADAVWTYLLTLGMPSLGVLLLVFEHRSDAELSTLAAVGFAALIVSLGVIIAVLRSERSARRIGGWAQRLLDPILRRMHRKAPDVSTALVDFHDTAHDLVVARWPQLTLTNVSAQLTPFLVLLAALGGVGALDDGVSLIEAFAAYSAALLLTSFPITPGGLVTVDGALIALLVAFGAPGPQAVGADLLWRLVWFLPQLLVGGGAMLWFLVAKRRAAHRSAAQEAAADLQPGD